MSPVAIFSNYLLIDTLVCSIPRFLFMAFLSGFRQNVCEPILDLVQEPTARPRGVGFDVHLDQDPTLFAELGCSRNRCLRIWWTLELAFCAGVVALMLLHFMMALQVRAHARVLSARGGGDASRHKAGDCEDASRFWPSHLAVKEAEAMTCFDQSDRLFQGKL